jgi:hypothetical protein
MHLRFEDFFSPSSNNKAIDAKYLNEISFNVSNQTILRIKYNIVVLNILNTRRKTTRYQLCHAASCTEQVFALWGSDMLHKQAKYDFLCLQTTLPFSLVVGDRLMWIRAYKNHKRIFCHVASCRIVPYNVTRHLTMAVGKKRNCHSTISQFFVQNTHTSFRSLGFPCLCMLPSVFYTGLYFSFYNKTFFISFDKKLNLHSNKYNDTSGVYRT